MRFPCIDFLSYNYGLTVVSYGYVFEGSGMKGRAGALGSLGVGSLGIILLSLVCSLT